MIATLIAMVGLAVLTTILTSGRGFLPSARNEILLHLRPLPDGTWSVESSEVVPSDFEWPAHPNGVAVLVQEVSTGRWDAGMFSAWRLRIWLVQQWRGLDADNIQDPQSPLSQAIRAHIEHTIIPQSPLWELWPRERIAPSPLPSTAELPQVWHARSRAGPHPFRGTAPWILLSSISIGAWVAFRVRDERPQEGSET